MYFTLLSYVDILWKKIYALQRTNKSLKYCMIISLWKNSDLMIFFDRKINTFFREMLPNITS